MAVTPLSGLGYPCGILPRVVEFGEVKHNRRMPQMLHALEIASFRSGSQLNSAPPRIAPSIVDR